MNVKIILTLLEEMNYRGAKKKKKKGEMSQLQGYCLLPRQEIMVSWTYVLEMGLMRHHFRLYSEEIFQKI